MSNSTSLNTPQVEVYPTEQGAARAAATYAGNLIRNAIREKGGARVLVGTGNSQIKMIDALMREPGIDWSRVAAFHLDEYVGISADHPASFRHWIRTRFQEKAKPGQMHYLVGDSPEVDKMARDYGANLSASPIDLAFVGIGENGHIAFNDPPTADFSDPLVVKRVVLDEGCRRQQVGEGHFPDMASVPHEAVTVSCTGLMGAIHWVCCVPDKRKATAVKGALEGPISTACPASLLRRHSSVALFLDAESASLLADTTLSSGCHVHP